VLIILSAQKLKTHYITTHWIKQQLSETSICLAPEKKYPP